MEKSEQNVIQQIEQAKKIAICIPRSEEIELFYASKILYDYLLNNGKEAGILVGGEISDQMKRFFDDHNIPYKQKSSPTSYVVSIDYAKTGLEKVKYDIDEKSGKLKFYLTPTQGEFDFNDVEYITEGNNFDLTITIGVDSFNNLGKLYQSSSYLFSDNSVIAIFKGSGSLGEYSISIPEDASLIYGIRTLLGSQIDQNSANIILQALLDSEPVLEGTPRRAFLREVQELSSIGGRWDESIKNSYFNKDYLNLDLQIKLMHHVMVDRESRVLWSKIDNKEFKFAGLTEGKFDPRGRIIFNISSDFDLAFAVYEVEKDNLYVVVESNDVNKYSAKNISGVFGGDGDDRHATFEIENMALRDFENKVFLVLSDMYGLSVKGTSAEFRGTSSVSKNKEKSSS